MSETRKKSIEWTDDEKERLIERWGAEACLYDTGHRAYHDNSARKSAAMRIVETMNKEGLDVQVRIFEKKRYLTISCVRHTLRT